MTKKTTEKNYKFTVKDGRAEVSKKYANKFMRSASCPYPMAIQRYNENTDKMEIVRLSRKETENYLLNLIAEQEQD